MKRSNRAALLAGLILPMALAAPAAAQDSEAGGEPVLAWQADYTIDSAMVVRDGATHSHVLGLASLSAELSLDRLAGWRGGKIRLHGIASHGGRPNDDAGTLQGIDNIEVADNRVRLFEAYFEQDFLRSRASVRLGFSDLNSEFYSTASSGLLIAPAFGIGSELSATGPNGPSIFPSSALTARLRYASRTGAYVQAAAVNAEAGVLGDEGGVRPLFGKGALLIAEAGIDRSDGTKLGFGAWTYTHRQEDLSETDTDGAPLRRRAWGIYALADLRIAGSAERPVNLFARAGLSDGHTTPYSGGWQAGVLASAVFAGRPASQFSFGAHQAFLGNEYRLGTGATGLVAHRQETGLELTYSDAIAPWLTVQPDVQVIWNGQHAGGSRQAWLFALRLRFSRSNP